MTAIQLTLENKDYQEALKKRGITDLSLIQIDPWPGGGIVNKNIKKGHRALKTISFLKETPSDNAYARPIQGLISHVDLTDNCVVEIEDHGVIKMAEASARYDSDSQEVLRSQPKEISITQPKGVGFQVSNNEISWEGWNLRVSLDPIEGLVIHNLKLEERPIYIEQACQIWSSLMDLQTQCILGKRFMMEQSMGLVLWQILCLWDAIV
mgnify:CR=1 FL=1